MHRFSLGVAGRLILLLLAVAAFAGVMAYSLLRPPAAAQAPPAPQPAVAAILAEARIADALEAAYWLLQTADENGVAGLRAASPLVAGMVRADAAGRIAASSEPALTAAVAADAGFLRGVAAAPGRVFVSGRIGAGQSANDAGHLLLAQASEAEAGALAAVLDLAAVTRLLEGLLAPATTALVLHHQQHGRLAAVGDGDSLLALERAAEGGLVDAAAETAVAVEAGWQLVHRRLGPGPLSVLAAMPPAPVPAPAGRAGQDGRVMTLLGLAFLLFLGAYVATAERGRAVAARMPEVREAAPPAPLPSAPPQPPEERVRRLAGGLAHDFDQVMQAVAGFADLALWKLARGQSPREEVARILTAGHRGGVLTRQLDAFAEPAVPPAPTIDLAVAVAECADQLIRGLPGGIEVERWLTADPLPAATTPGEVEQVVGGLVAQALIILQGRGPLRLALDRTSVTAGLAAQSGALAPGDYVRLEVRAVGPVLDAEAVAQLFDPFRETRPELAPGCLDLAVATAVLQRRGGGLAVRSEPGSGTSFAAYWPLRAETAPPTAESVLPAGAGEIVLTVNDDPDLVRLSEDILRRLGLQPVGCHDPAEALALFRADPGHYDLVVTDHLMPALTGAELAREMTRLRPDLPVILLTGYRGLALAEPEPPPGVREVLDLPLLTHTLGPAVARCLEQARTAPATEAAPAAG